MTAWKNRTVEIQARFHPLLMKYEISGCDEIGKRPHEPDTYHPGTQHQTLCEKRLYDHMPLKPEIFKWPPLQLIEEWGTLSLNYS